MLRWRLIAVTMVFAATALFWPLGSSSALAFPRAGISAANMIDKISGTNSLKTDVRARRYYPRYRHAGRGYRHYGYRHAGRGYRHYGYRNRGYRNHGWYYGGYYGRYYGPYPYAGYNYVYSDADDYYNGGDNGGNAHVEWCLNRYRSYNPRTDTFTGYDGRQHYCNSPY